MNGCPLEDEVVAWVAGDRSGAETRAIEAHVDVCESCRHLVAHLVRATAPQGRRVGRYVLGELLGRGGMGEVYAATLAGDASARVAVKLLHAMDAATLLQFKREFRALADISHPNLALLHELGHDGDTWFIAMERVSGSDFASYVAGGEARLRAALAQLARGLVAIHAAGHVHSDIKPSNVHVDDTGRVVILDFGLVARAAKPEKRFAGTPGYMAPEQRGGFVSPASDWYAVGVMLKRALKNGPSATDLERLAARLLENDPVRRGGAREIADALGHEHGFGAASVFVGREKELARLRDEFEETCRGRGRALVITGPPGIGKTTLVRRFVESIRDRANVVEGRCYERESVPLKALDPVVDELVSVLSKMSRAERTQVRPRDAADLSRMFPTLRRIWDDPEPAADAHDSKTRATKALRELVARIAALRPLVLVIDDLQWSDHDSRPILAELLRPPMPPFMLVACSRPSSSHAVSVDRAMPLAPLDATSARAIARGLAVDDEESLEAIVREAEGNPLFVEELARGGARDHVSLDDVIVHRMEQLHAPERRVLAALAIAGKPVPFAMLASGLGIDDARAAETRLRTARWAESRDGETIEIAHDRVASAILGTISDGERRDWHRKLALTMEIEYRDRTEPETILEHWRGAGDDARAARYAHEAATRAMRRLAFVHAARLCELTISLDADAAKEPDVWARLAEAHASAGRGADSARAYLEAKTRAHGDAALDYGRLAAEQLLRSGRIDAGLDALRATMKALHVRLPASPHAALVSLAARRLLVRARLARPVSIHASTLQELRALDACFAVASALGTVDTVRGADLHAHTLLLALRAGDAPRIARSLASEAAFTATAGTKGRRRTEALFDRAEALSGHDDAQRATITGARGMALYLRGEWRRAHVACASAADLFARTSGSVWEKQTSRLYSLLALTYLGELERLRDPLRRELEDADERGDLYMSTSLRTAPTNLSWLAAGDVTGAREAAEIGERTWSRKGFHLQHHWSMLAQCNVDLYEGDGLRAAARVDASWTALRASRLRHIVVVDVEALHLRARASLASGAVRRAVSDARRMRSLDVPHARAFAELIEAAVDVRDHRARAAARFRNAAARLRERAMMLHAAAAERRCAELLGETTQSVDSAMRAMGIAEPQTMTRLLVPIP